MQTPTRMDEVVFESYDHMATMDEYMNQMELAHLLSNFSLNLRDPFCTSAFLSTFLITI